MNHLEIPQEYLDLWDSFPFRGFDNKDKIPYWKKYAGEFISLLREGNSALVADTSAGKTAITILIITACKFRTLFLVPTRILTEQHQELLEKITGQSYDSQVYTGITKNRDWNNPNHRIIFATAHILLNDIKRAKVKLNDFDLIVLDEFQKSRGNFPYVPIARLAHKAEVKILGLSASPGGTLNIIEKIKKSCYLKNVRRIDIPVPPKTESLVIAEMNESLKTIDSLFQPLIKQNAINLDRLGFNIDVNRIITAKELKLLEATIINCKGNEKYYSAISAYAQYRKLHHAFTTVMSEGYYTFLDYARRLKDEDNTQAARTICMNKDWQQIVYLANEAPIHPKIARLLEVTESLINMGKGMIIFVYERVTGKYLKEVLNSQLKNIRAEIIFGGQDSGKTKLHQDILKRFATGKLNTLIATSVIEEGLSTPAVNAVIQYSMPPTEIARLQRSGRAGRFESGIIVYIALKHFLDQAMYWSTKRGVQTMKQVLSNGPNIIMPKIEKKPRKKIDTITLPLFPD